MQAESLDILEKGDLTAPQARAIVRAIETEIAGASNQLATKHDLKNETTLLRSELKSDMLLLRSELKSDMTALRSELKGDIMVLRSELKEDISKLEVRLEGQIHASTSGIARQMYTAILGQMAVLLGFAYFFATHLR